MLEDAQLRSLRACSRDDPECGARRGVSLLPLVPAKAGTQLLDSREKRARSMYLPRRCGGSRARVAEGGAEWIKKIALADDLEGASPPHVLSYWQALDTARALARRQPGEAIDESRPLTVAEALDRYETDLKARGGDPYNVRHVRLHLTGSILSKPG